ncbi:uncharacterized protein ACA1_064690 [Acanthamoeba castellanii str. Neff]|uniref:R3H domain-containing protein n=1 Tax=Acanthamoeba castellanii (strain ATCC 30010 / Neff) TaxID=1257118 RepID=L8GXM0_ACACF|nr:uncharacterized protein ACA1_064690 [Acanthamoeba castellanii str. Neff]ELR17682.1 hypothetical protein ACA1_064690 [Acanthamoeba castellanii str. Neff]
MPCYNNQACEAPPTFGDPKNEGPAHYRTKQKLMQLLSSANSLDVAVACASPWGSPAGPRAGSLTDEGGRGGGKFWRCRNERVVSGWARGWKEVESEFTIRGVGRLDLALLYKHSNYESYNQTKNLNDALTSEAAKKRAKEERKIKEILVHEQYRNWFTDLVKFRQAAVAHAVYTFPHSLTAFDRMIVHRFADFLQLGHNSEDLPEARANSRDPTRQLTVTKLPEPRLELQDQAMAVEGVVAVEVYDTSKIGPLKKARLGRANLPWIEVATLPYHTKPQMPLRVLRIAGHPHDGGREHDGRRGEYVNIAPALEEVSFDSTSSHARRHGDGGAHLHKEWRWVCSDCSTKLQHRLVFTRIGAVVDWYMSRGSRGGYGKLVRRVFSILEDRADPAANAAEYFLVEGGFNVLNRLHLHEHENHLLARSTSLDDLREAFEQRLVAISGREGGHTQAVVERVAWPGVAPADLFDARDREILGGVPSFPTPSLLFPSLERKLQPVMAWDVQERRWRDIDGRQRPSATV